MTLKQALRKFGHLADDQYPCMECGATHADHNERARHIWSAHPVYVGKKVWP